MVYIFELLCRLASGWLGRVVRLIEPIKLLQQVVIVADLAVQHLNALKQTV